MLVVCKHAVGLRLYCTVVDDPLAVIIHGNLAFIRLFHAHDTFDQG